MGTSRTVERSTLSARISSVLLVALGIAVLAAGPVSAYRRPGSLIEISGPDGGRDATISANGRYVAFNTSLKAGAANVDRGIVRYDRVRDRLEPVSVAPVDLTAISKTQLPSMDAGGRYVAFQSNAPNLVPGDTNGADDIFVRDMVADETIRVSVADRTGRQANGYSAAPSISGNGRFVAFQSDSSNLTRGGSAQSSKASRMPEIFVRDLTRGRTRRVPLRPRLDVGLLSPACEVAGSHLTPQKFGALSVSNDGRFVAFSSDANNLVPDDSNNESYCMNGNFATRGWDVYVFDLKKRQIERVSVSSSGEEGDGDSTADEGYEGSDIRLSADGRFVSFQSSAANLIPSDTNGASDVFVYDRRHKRVERVSVDPIGAEADDFSSRPSLSLSGRYVTFVTAATNLDGEAGAVVFDRRSGSVDLVSRDSRRRTGADLLYPAVSNNGRYVAFQTTAHLLGDGDDTLDMFLRDRGPAAGGVVGNGAKDAYEGEDPCGLQAGPQCVSPLCIGDICLEPQGAARTRDDSGDVAPALAGIGGDLVGARVAYRPRHRDVVFFLDVDHLPSVYLDHAGISRPTATGILYGVRFRSNGNSYEALASWNGVGEFSFRVCSVDGVVCSDRSPIEGSYGTTGNTIVLSVPLGPAGIEPGDRLENVRAFSALAALQQPLPIHDGQILDRVRLARSSR